MMSKLTTNNHVKFWLPQRGDPNRVYKGGPPARAVFFWGGFKGRERFQQRARDLKEVAEEAAYASFFQARFPIIQERLIGDLQRESWRLNQWTRGKGASRQRCFCVNVGMSVAFVPYEAEDYLVSRLLADTLEHLRGPEPHRQLAEHFPMGNLTRPEWFLDRLDGQDLRHQKPQEFSDDLKAALDKAEAGEFVTLVTDAHGQVRQLKQRIETKLEDSKPGEKDGVKRQVVAQWAENIESLLAPVAQDGGLGTEAAVEKRLQDELVDEQNEHATLTALNVRLQRLHPQSFWGQVQDILHDGRLESWRAKHLQRFRRQLAEELLSPFHLYAEEELSLLFANAAKDVTLMVREYCAQQEQRALVARERLGEAITHLRREAEEAAAALSRLPRSVHSSISFDELNRIYDGQLRPKVPQLAQAFVKKLGRHRQAADCNGEHLLTLAREMLGQSSIFQEIKQHLSFGDWFVRLTANQRRKLFHILYNQATPGVSLEAGYLASSLPPNPQEPYRELLVVFVPPELSQDDRALISAEVPGLAANGLTDVPGLDAIVVSCQWVGLPLMAFEHLVTSGKRAFRAHSNPRRQFLFDDQWETLIERYEPAPDPTKQTDWDMVPDKEVVLCAVATGALRTDDNGVPMTFHYKSTKLGRTLRADSLESLVDGCRNGGHLEVLRSLLSRFHEEAETDDVLARFQNAMCRWPEYEGVFYELHQRWFA